MLSAKQMNSCILENQEELRNTKTSHLNRLSLPNHSPEHILSHSTEPNSEMIFCLKLRIIRLIGDVMENLHEHIDVNAISIEQAVAKLIEAIRLQQKQWKTQKSSLEQLNKKIEIKMINCQAEVDRLETDNMIQKSKLEKYRRTTQNQFEEHQKMIESKNQELQALESKLQSTVFLLNEQQHLKAKFESKFEHCSNELKGYKEETLRKLNKYSERLKSEKNRADCFKNEVDKLKSLNLHVCEKENTLRLQNEKIVANLETLTLKNEKQSQQIVNLEAKNQRLNLYCQQLDQKLTHQKETNQTLSHSLMDFGQKININQALICKMADTINNKIASIESLKSQIRQIILNYHQNQQNYENTVQSIAQSLQNIEFSHRQEIELLKQEHVVDLKEKIKEITSHELFDENIMELLPEINQLVNS